MTYQNTRRHFLQTAAASAATVSLAANTLANRVPTGAELKGQLFKTLKIGMVGEGSTLTAKFKAAKAAGVASSVQMLQSRDLGISPARGLPASGPRANGISG